MLATSLGFILRNTGVGWGVGGGNEQNRNSKTVSRTCAWLCTPVILALGSWVRRIMSWRIA